jgi:hypothetical protein
MEKNSRGKILCITSRDTRQSQCTQSREFTFQRHPLVDELIGWTLRIGAPRGVECSMHAHDQPPTNYSKETVAECVA